MYYFEDKNRFEVQEKYWNFLESEDNDFCKAIEILKNLIKDDPDFFDPYISLAAFYKEDGKYEKMFELLKEGYNRAMKLVIKNEKFPDELHWLYMENRHIIRMIFNYGLLMWEVNEKDEALRIFGQLLASNTNDNIGARYAIIALLEGLPSMEAYEEKFMSKDGYGLDANRIERWFQKASKNHLDEIGWWFDIDADM